MIGKQPERGKEGPSTQRNLERKVRLAMYIKWAAR